MVPRSSRGRRSARGRRPPASGTAGWNRCCRNSSRTALRRGWPSRRGASRGGSCPASASAPGSSFGRLVRRRESRSTPRAIAGSSHSSFQRGDQRVAPEHRRIPRDAGIGVRPVLGVGQQHVGVGDAAPHRLVEHFVGRDDAEAARRGILRRPLRIAGKRAPGGHCSGWAWSDLLAERIVDQRSCVLARGRARSGRSRAGWVMPRGGGVEAQAGAAGYASSSP